MKMIFNLLLCILVCFFAIQSTIAQKLSKTLEEQIAKAGSSEYIRAVIEMTDKVPVSEITALTFGKNKSDARKIVNDQIREFTSISQKAVLDALKIAEAEGEVRNIISIRSVNKIVMEAKKSLFNKIQNRNDINSIYYEKPAGLTKKLIKSKWKQ
jgi:hypothetical protein